MSNVAIAAQYARKVSSILTPGGTWPHTLESLSNKEVQQVLNVYKQYFSKVDYQPSNKFVVCIK
jgi:hypothetical protein